MIKLTQEDVFKTIDCHKKYLNGNPFKCRADFSKQWLNNLHFSASNLYGAFFNNANLKYSRFLGTNLQYADFSGANLFGASLTNADLQGADFSGANLFNADLSGANLANVKVDYNTQGLFLACPSHGAFTAFKRAGGYIVVLEIPADAQRSSATTYKCRCNKAKVLRIENLDGTPAAVDSVVSNHDKDFIYKVGETVSVENFDEDRWKECSTGIHFFIDRDLAVIY